MSTTVFQPMSNKLIEYHIAVQAGKNYGKSWLS